MPGGTIGVPKNVLELGERFLSAPVQPGTGLIELSECLLKEELHTEGTTVNADLCFRIPTLELVLLREFGSVILFAVKQKDGFLFESHLG